VSPRGKRVTASQIGMYAYCAQAWWLATIEKFAPVDPDPLVRGTRVHERHGWQVAAARSARKLAWFLMGAAVTVLLIWGGISLL
jgi:hypothetical protein